MNYILPVVSIGFLILIHELGHFIAARISGIPVAQFSVGFGPAVWKRTRRGTEYRLSLIPLGGYVLPAMEDEAQFFQIPVRKRIFLSLGGPAANLLFPLLLLAVMNCIQGGFSVYSVLIQPLAQSAAFFSSFVTALPALFSSPDSLSGAIGIVSQGSSFIGSDIIRFMQFSVIISLNLAVFNLLPIPALDGGKVLIYLLEKIHPRLARLHLPLSIAGWLVIMGLMVYTTVLDVGRLL